MKRATKKKRTPSLAAWRRLERAARLLRGRLIESQLSPEVLEAVDALDEAFGPVDDGSNR